MKIKDLLDNIQNPEWSIYDFVLNKITDFNNEREYVLKLNNVLKTTYIINSFMSEVNNGGLDYYYDVCVFYKDLEDCLIEINDLDMLSIIKKSNKIIYDVEKRINDSIHDNIENITDEESEELQLINDLYYDFENNLIKKLRNYVLNNVETEI